MNRVAFAACGVILLSTFSSCKLSVHKDGFSWQDKVGSVKTEVSYMVPPEVYTAGAFIYDPSGVKEISIDWLSDSVAVEAYDGDVIAIEELCEQPLSDSNTVHHYLDEEGDLHILYGKPQVGFNRDASPHKQLLVKVPRKLQLAGLSVDGEALGVRVDGVNCEEMSLDLLSSLVKLNDCVIGELEIEGLKCHLFASFSQMPREIQMDNITSEAHFTVPKDAGMAVYMDGLSTDFYSELPVIKNGHASASVEGDKTSFNSLVIGDGACEITCEGVSVKVDIKVGNAQ